VWQAESGRPNSLWRTGAPPLRAGRATRSVAGERRLDRRASERRRVRCSRELGAARYARDDGPFRSSSVLLSRVGTNRVVFMSVCVSAESKSFNAAVSNCRNW